MLKRYSNHLGTPLYKNSFYILGSYAILGILGFVFWVTAARLFSEYEVGVGSAIISTATFLVLISLLGFDSSLVYFLPKEQNKTKLINLCFTLGGLVGVGTAGIFLVGLPLWAPGLLEVKSASLFLIVILALPVVTTLTNIQSSVFLAYRKTQYIFIKTLILSPLKVLLLFPIVLLFPLFGISVSQLLALGITVGVALIFLLPKIEKSYKIRPTLNLKILPNSFWKYSSGVFLTKFLISAPELILPLIVLNLLGAQQNAHFYMAWITWTLLASIPFSISQSLFAEGVHSPRELRSNTRKALQLAFLLIIPIVVILVVAGRWLLLAFGEVYSINSYPLLRIIALTAPFAILPLTYTGVLKATSRIKELVTLWGLVTTSILVGSYLAVPHFGIIGVGYTLLATQFTASIYILVGRRLPL